MITLEGLGALWIAVARKALDARIAVVVLLALVALASAEPGLALALAGVLVTGRRGRPHRITVTVFAARSTGYFPMILRTSIFE